MSTQTGLDPTAAADGANEPDLSTWSRLLAAAPELAAGLCDEHGVIQHATPGLATLLGRSNPDLAGRALPVLADPGDPAALEAALEEVRSGRSLAGPVRVRVGKRWIDLTLTHLGNGLVLTLAVDVTTEGMVRRWLQIMSDNALDIVAVIDSEGLITWVSPSVRIVLGRSPDALVGHDLTTLVAPEDLQGLSDALAGGEAGQEPTPRVVRFRSTSGAYRYMSVIVRPVSDNPDGARTAIGMRDVTEELRAKRELARSEEQFRMAMHGAPEGMAVTDSQDRIVQVNPALCELLGVDTHLLIGHRFREFIPEDEREQFDHWRDRLLRGKAAAERSQHRLVGPNEVWVDHSVGVMRDDLGNPYLFVHQFADRTAARRLQADLAYRASHDVQTGLANRESLMTRLEQRLGRAPESSDRVGLLFCDIDNLKPINDGSGHLVGDAVISAVATRLERAVRRQDVVARIGGDEFVILLESCSSVSELSVVARNVQAAASHPVETSVGPIDVTITVGAVLADSAADTDEALARADDALYRAKRAGRNRISVEDLADA